MTVYAVAISALRLTDDGRVLDQMLASGSVVAYSEQSAKDACLKKARQMFPADKGYSHHMVQLTTLEPNDLVVVNLN